MASLNARTVSAPLAAAGGLVLAAWAANEANRFIYGHTTVEAMNEPLKRQFTATLVAIIVFSTVFSTTAQIWLKVT